MKQTVQVIQALLFYLSLPVAVIAQTGKVGINTTAPQAMLHVKDSSVLFSGLTSLPGTAGNPPAIGQGIRMMWYPDKAAFRAGYVSSVNWNRDSIGDYSFAVGSDTKASGMGSVAMGSAHNSSGTNSVAMGYGNTAKGDYSIATGLYSAAFSNQSTAMGHSTIASGNAATTMGFNTKAIGDQSTAMGHSTTASGNISIAVGNGTTASGSISTAMGFSTIASGNFSTAMGESTIASGNAATTMGYNTKAIGDQSTAMGNSTKAIGNNSVAMGANTTASGRYSMAAGHGTTAKSFASLVIGINNDSIITSNSESWIDTDPVFIIGNGTTSNTVRNAFIVAKNGETGINVANGMPEALLHLKAREASFAMHLKLENVANSDYASILYDGSLKLRTFGTDDEYQWRNAANTTTMRLTNAGRLGINSASPASMLHINGSVSKPIQTTTANIAVDENDYTVIILPTAVAVVITLPAATTCSGREYVFVNKDGSNFTFSLNYLDMTNVSTNALLANSSITLQSDGVNWHRIR